MLPSLLVKILTMRKAGKDSAAGLEAAVHENTTSGYGKTHQVQQQRKGLQVAQTLLHENTQHNTSSYVKEGYKVQTARV